MSYELLSAVASIGTFVVIAATAIAAIVQLRHMRAGNQISTILGLTAELESVEMQERFTFILQELPQKMKDPVFRAGYETIPVDRSTHPEMYVLDFYHKLGTLAILDLVDKDVLFSFEIYRIPKMWELLEPSIAIMRRRGDRSYGV